jgi:hypothetical protein
VEPRSPASREDRAGPARLSAIKVNGPRAYDLARAGEARAGGPAGVIHGRVRTRRTPTTSR